jgi:esterase/lipase superfamily enzyme
MRFKQLLPVLVIFISAGACAPKTPVPQWLMPTPQIFRDGRVKPFVHLPERDKNPEMEIFYATNRIAEGEHYGDMPSGELRFGTASLSMGPEGESWDSLVVASTTDPREKPIELRLVSSSETGEGNTPKAASMWAKAIEGDVLHTETKDIVVYVHGAKVGFLHSCAFAAELDHYGGRDFTPVAFDWPTHQEIVSYVDGVDLNYTIPSAKRLAEMLGILSEQTSARRIHIVSWSAGARVVSGALTELGGSHPASVRDRYRLGTVVFAAGEVPENLFIERLPAIHGLSDRVLVYLSDDDSALRWASRLMGGGRRLGLEPETLTDQEKKVLHEMPRLEVVDTSYGKGIRGFDITGHRYWFQHPWVNSDLILALRTKAKPAQRGLSAAPVDDTWYFGSDYQQNIGSIGQTLTTGEW